MTLRHSPYGFGLLAAFCCGAAMAQSGPSPVGTWHSGLITNPRHKVAGVPPVSDTVELTVTNVEADQRVSGRFIAFEQNTGMPSLPLCRSGPVSGTFDGAALKMITQATRLCPERVFDLRMEDGKLAGKYKHEVSGFLDVTFTRKP